MRTALFLTAAIAAGIAYTWLASWAWHLVSLTPSDWQYDPAVVTTIAGVILIFIWALALAVRCNDADNQKIFEAREALEGR